MTKNMNPPRCVRTATIIIELVAVPVKLYTSTESADSISFNLLHETCGSRLKQQHACSTCVDVIGDKKVPVVVEKEKTVKGYEHTKGQYITFTADEIAAIDAVATNEIKVTEFVKLTAVDPVYIEKTYYVGPDKGSERAYQLVTEAMVETGRVGVGTYARGGEERVVMLRPFGKGLAIHELRYASEIKSADAVPNADDVVIKPIELRLAKQLIDRLSSAEFVPERYVDTVLERQRKMIEEKIAGGDIVVAPTPPQAIPDLIEALKASFDTAHARTSKRVTAAKQTPKARVARVVNKKKAS
jgi:DNA end-binding protein Ku